MKNILLLLCSVGLLVTSKVHASFVPHDAMYDIRLQKTDSRASIQSITGQLKYQIQDQCDVWVIDSDMRMSIVWPEVVRNMQRTMLLSEAKDDSVGSFVVTNTEQMRSGRRGTLPVSDLVEGRLELTPDAPGKLLMKDAEATVEVPAGTLLTTRHLMTMVEAARNGKKFVRHTVLDPSLERQIAVVSGFILGTAQDERLSDEGQAWSMRLAYFPLDQADAAPDYELAIVISETGVVSSFVQYVDDMEVSGELSRFERLDPIDCG